MQIDTDDVLLARVREDGDVAAFGCLYERHAGAARRFAWSLCANDADADDLTAEVFTGLLASLRRGNGPTQLALPYLFASIKHRHWRTTGRRAKETALASTTGVSAAYEANDIVEADVVRTALSTLPAGVQALLWRTEVDDQSPEAAAEWDAMSAHNLAVHRHRARRALGTAYLAQHAEPDGGLTGLDPECHENLPHLASLVRGNIGVRRRRRIERHLAVCAQCSTARQRLELISTRLRSHPKLPWSFWTAGLSTIKAQVSGWFGTSAVTLAGPGFLAAAAILVPAPALMEPLGGRETAAVAPASERQLSSSLVADAGSASVPRPPDAPDEQPDDAIGEPWFRLPAAPSESDANNPPAVEPSIHTATTSAPHSTVAVTPAAEPRADVASEASPQVGSTSGGPTRAPTVQHAADSDGKGAQSGRDDEQGSGVDDGGQGVTGGTNGRGKGRDNGQGSGNVNATAGDNASGQGNANGQGNGQANGNGNASGQGNANGQGNGQANGNGNASGQGNANGQGNGQANGNGQENGNTSNGQVVGDGRNTAAGRDAPSAHGNAQSGTGGQGHGNGQGVANGHAHKADLPLDGDGVQGDGGAAPVTHVEVGEL